MCRSCHRLNQEAGEAHGKKVTDKMTPAGKKLFAELQKLTEMQVQVGFTVDKKGGNQNHASVDASDYEDGTTVAEVAMWNEFGTRNADGSQRIPERPFMRQSVEKYESQIKAMVTQQLKAVATGGTAEDALRKVGALQVGLIQNEIRNGGFQKNADSTIEQKKSSQPLIDGGHMRQSVHYVVKPRKG